jgi:choline dehydrogenase-like flavoprotein
VWDGWISSEASLGTVRALPTGRPDITYNFADPDVRRLQEANALLCELFAAAGSKEVMTSIRGLPEVMDPAEAAREIRLGTFSELDLPTASNHVMGGSAMGSNRWGKVYDVDDLYVCDTGLYPASPGVNPQLTVMALAHRLGTELPRRY